MENLKSLILKDIWKSFGEKDVLTGINLTFEKGKVYALLGENGSGKSTLAKIISGEIIADKGMIFFSSEKKVEVKIRSPKDAIKNKIGIVSQNPTICKDLQLWENVLLGDKKILSPFFVNKAKEIEKVKNHIEGLGFPLYLEKNGKDSRASEKFFVCLARTLFLEKDILILDEPTASLSKEEKSVLFSIIEKQKQLGKIIIVITHNREEALALSDKVVFLQKGKNPLIGEEARKRVELFSFDDAGSDVVASRDSSSFISDLSARVGSEERAIFEVKSLYAYESPLSKIEDLSFSVEFGKITCVKGQWETGLALLEDIVSGMRTFSEGEICFFGKSFTKDSKPKFDTRLLRQKGTSIIPSDKINRGSPSSLRVEDLFLGGKEDFIQDAGVDAKLSTKIGSLSGGMLQRLILKRELSLDSELYIFSNPTSGLDFAGIRELVATLENLKKAKKGILVLSVDDIQIEKISDICVNLEKPDSEMNQK